MPTRYKAETWVISLRDMLKTSVGSWLRIGEQSNKCKIDIRYDNGKREVGTIPILWKQANATEIYDSVNKIATLVKSGRTLRESIEAFYGSSPTAPVAVEAPSPELIKNSWQSFGESKLKRNQIKESTWKGVYAKSFKRLEKVLDKVVDAETCLTIPVEDLEGGCRTREITVQHLAQWLRFAVGQKHLDAQRWSPPPEQSKEIKDYIGETTKKATEGVPIYDNEFLELINQLSKNREGKAAQRWILALQIFGTYGIRPAEIEHLRIQTINGEKSLFCDYIKRSGGGSTLPRELVPIHDYWEKEFDLLNKIEKGYPLPSFTGGVAEATRKYLQRQEYWKKLVKERGLKVYCFRHGFAWRIHTDPKYCNKISTRMAASLMGHSHETHIRSYGQWTPAGSVRNSIRDLLKD